MRAQPLIAYPTYTPEHLLDTVLDRLQLKNDAALCRALDVAPPVISKIRHRRLAIGASLLLRLHELTGLTIRELRTLMGDRRRTLRLHEQDRLTEVA